MIVAVFILCYSLLLKILKHFDAFVSESSIHMSEYVPYFRRTPALIDRYTDEKMWGVAPKGMSRDERIAAWRKRRQAQEEKNRHLAYGSGEIPMERSHEYYGRILNAIETNVPYLFNGNVVNTGLITNLPPGLRCFMASTTGFHTGVVSMMESSFSLGSSSVSPAQVAPSSKANSRSFSLLANTKTLELG